MTTLAQPVRKPGTRSRSGYIFHESFRRPTAEARYRPAEEVIPRCSAGEHLDDDTTRSLARRMHYAAYRMDTGGGRAWAQRYHQLRDAIIVGNHRLIYRVVHNCRVPASDLDDAVGECQLVLIRAVALYNPWLTIRFSTYAYTCLLRAVRRFQSKLAHQRNLVAGELEHVPALPEPEADADLAPPGRLSHFLHAGHPLLTDREKTILARRFYHDATDLPTLKALSSELGISKERVRQLQCGALNKLRLALVETQETYGNPEAL